MVKGAKPDPLQTDLIERMGRRVVDTFYERRGRHLLVASDNGVMFQLRRPSLVGPQGLGTYSNFFMLFEGRGSLLKCDTATYLGWLRAKGKEKQLARILSRATVSRAADSRLKSLLQSVNSSMGAEMGDASVWEAEPRPGAILAYRWYSTYWPRFPARQPLGERIQHGLDGIANLLLTAYSTVVPQTAIEQ